MHLECYFLKRDRGSVPGLGTSPGEGKGHPLQYSDVQNSMGSQRVGHNWATFTFTFPRRNFNVFMQNKYSHNILGFLVLDKWDKSCSCPDIYIDHSLRYLLKHAIWHPITWVSSRTKGRLEDFSLLWNTGKWRLLLCSL